MRFWPFHRQAVEPQERTWAMKQIMDSAKADLERGDTELKPARRLSAATWKVKSGVFNRYLLRKKA